MSKHLSREIVAERAIVRDTARRTVIVDRSFELPKSLYGATVAFYLGFIAVMAVGLPTPGLAIPMAIFALFVVVGFSLPAIWTHLNPETDRKPLSWDRLRGQGISTHTGRIAARDAAAQVLILPALVFAWGVTMLAVIALV